MKTLIAWREVQRQEGMLGPKRKCKRDRNTGREEREREEVVQQMPNFSRVE